MLLDRRMEDKRFWTAWQQAFSIGLVKICIIFIACVESVLKFFVYGTWPICEILESY
jgi:hypothetical protein